MIISIDTEKASDKIQYPLMIKTLRKLCIEKSFLNLITNIYKKPTTNLILNGEKLEVFLLRLETRQGCLLSTLLSSIILEVPINSKELEKEIKRYTDWER